MTAEEIAAAFERIRAGGDSPPRTGPDPVNMPMVHHWLAALGDANPLYDTESVAPPAMAQVWTMQGPPGPHRPPPDERDPLAAMSAVLDEAGYTSVVATNCEQTYHRYLREGERVAVSSRLSSVAGPKRTSLGEGWFVTTESTWYAGDEAVATMTFRILKFKPRPAPAPAAPVIRPVVSRDTAFFWEGTAKGELRIQQCGACGALRHPPGPACHRCAALDPQWTVADGRGEIYSYVVHHHPAVPGKRLPIVVLLVQLAEGVRMVGELLDAPPDGVHVGQPVEVTFVRVDDELTLPAWRLA